LRILLLSFFFFFFFLCFFLFPFFYFFYFFLVFFYIIFSFLLSFIGKGTAKGENVVVLTLCVRNEDTDARRKKQEANATPGKREDCRRQCGDTKKMGSYLNPSLSLPPPSPQGGIASVSAHCRRRGRHEASYDGFLCLEILVILRDGVVFTPRRLTVGSVPVFLVKESTRAREESMWWYEE